MLIKVITIIECGLKACSHPSCMNNSLILQNKNLSVFVLENDSQKSRPIANYYAFKITLIKTTLCVLSNIFDSESQVSKESITRSQLGAGFNSFYNTVVHRFTAHV